MLNKLSLQRTFAASLALLVLPLAGAAAAGMLNVGRSRAGAEVIARTLASEGA